MYTQKSIVLCHNDFDDHDDDGNDEEEDVMQLLKQTKRGNRCLENSKCNSLR